MIKNQTEQVVIGGTIKAVDGQTYGGYLVKFTDSDNRDLYGEYFDRETNFMLKTYPLDGSPVLYNHGMDPGIHAVPIGRIKSHEVRDDGIYAMFGLGFQKNFAVAIEEENKSLQNPQEWLDEQNANAKLYEEMLREMIENGQLKWSSGAVGSSVLVDQNGHIERWGMAEGSGTMTPAEWKGETLIQSVKSIPFTELKVFVKNADDSNIDNTQTNPKEDSMTYKISPDEFVEALRDLMGQLDVEDSEENEEERGIVEEALTEGLEDMPEDLDDQDEEEQVKAWVKILNLAGQRLADRRNEQEARSEKRKAAMKKGARSFQKKGSKSRTQSAGGREGVPTYQPNISVSGKYDHASAEDLSYLHMIMTAGGKNWQPNDPNAYYNTLVEKVDKRGMKFSQDVGQKAFTMMNAIKANELDYSTQAGYGDEWVPDLWQNSVWEAQREETRIASLFAQVDMPSDPFNLPIEGADPTVSFVPETTAEAELLLSGAGNPIPDSKIGTGKVQLDTGKLALRVGISSELVEDSLIPVLPQFSKQATTAIVEMVDNVILNGDATNAATGNINLDDADPADTLGYLIFNGLRHSALVEATAYATDAGGAGLSLANLRTMRFTLPAGIYNRTKDLAFIVGAEGEKSLLNLDEVVTMDKLGANATVVTGMIGAIDGIPVISSQYMGLTEADGKISTTGSNNTLGQVVLVYRPNWFVGYRRKITINVAYHPGFDAHILVATARVALAHRATDSAAVLYNLAV